jgi:hypothetical protein
MDLDCDRPPPSADVKSSDSEASELLREFLRKRDMISLFFFRTKSTIQEDPRGFNAIDRCFYPKRWKRKRAPSSSNDYSCAFSPVSLSNALEELIFLSKISNVYTSLSLEEIALRAKRERERERERDLRKRKKGETLLETICARA